MNKTQLVKELARHASIPQKTARLLLDIFFDAVVSELEKGGRAEFRGFGAFGLKQYDGYTGKNPSSGEKIQIPPKKLASFKAFDNLLKTEIEPGTLRPPLGISPASADNCGADNPSSFINDSVFERTTWKKRKDE